jgi:hypothetical protein
VDGAFRDRKPDSPRGRKRRFGGRAGINEARYQNLCWGIHSVITQGGSALEPSTATTPLTGERALAHPCEVPLPLTRDDIGAEPSEAEGPGAPHSFGDNLE